MRFIDEKHGVGDVVSLGKFRKKRMSENLRCCRFKLCMVQFVCLGVNCVRKLLCDFRSPLERKAF